MPVSTYCPGLVVLSLTRKSPSRTSSLSASRLLMRLWYHVSLRSCSSFGATGARRRGGLGHWSSRTWTPTAAAEALDPTAPPHASWSFRASSKGSTGTVKYHSYTQEYWTGISKLKSEITLLHQSNMSEKSQSSLMSKRSFLGLSGGLPSLAPSFPSRFRLSKFWVLTYWCSS